MKKIIFILVIIVLGYFAWQKWGVAKKDEAQKKPAVIVTLATATLSDVPLELRNVGTVVPIQSVGVKSRLDSQIMEIKFKDGDYVKAGDLLFVLDDRTLKAQLTQQQASLAAGNSQLENLRAQYERNQQLIKSGFESQANVDDSKTAYVAQVANVKAIEAAVESLRVQLEYTKITAPISGRTGTINSTLGNTVKANDTGVLVVINQVMPIRVQLSMPQDFISKVRNAMSNGGVQVGVMQDNSKELLSGRLEYIDNNVDAQTGTFVARAIFENMDEKLWPGMFVNLLVNLGTEKQVLTIPEVSVQHGQDYDFVFVIDGDTAKKRKIITERLQGNVAVIKEGLNSGEQVATDGMLGLSDGSKISVAEKKADAPAAADATTAPAVEAPSVDNSTQNNSTDKNTK